ncbi:signal recognition particle, SRP9/SRP14 subunit [Polychytrium aggregatum]|uniref:signal recognition particle, SRP9/SRP14 subunit n=1 Tax=Polychytrium aggregatum TaxID=110093 RepID=UPI0022FF1ED8|nr:signal recognition particle, SRP9/SRP14 subunit [Polychytrium aggregatum]KAI9205960.1 signal recognition particle, SRP9/SRP14 subunit [Polychytrium aggregatum]
MGAKQHLENHSFLAQLNTHFGRTKSSGTVFLTMKRYTYDKKKEQAGQSAKDVAEADSSVEYPSIVRAVIGKAKISTIVHPSDTDKFLESYTHIIRANMDALKKKERPKKQKKQPKAE